MEYVHHVQTMNSAVLQAIHAYLENVSSVKMTTSVQLVCVRLADSANHALKSVVQITGTAMLTQENAAADQMVKHATQVLNAVLARARQGCAQPVS